MRLSPDEIIFWQFGLLKLNATIVFTWGLMIVLAVGSKLITRRLSTGMKRSRWQNLLEIVVTGMEKQIEEVGSSCLLPQLASAPSFPATHRRLARSRPRLHSRCACLWPCRSLASRSKGLVTTSSPI
jgi:hypothetical protein